MPSGRPMVCPRDTDALGPERNKVPRLLISCAMGSSTDRGGAPRMAV